MAFNGASVQRTTNVALSTTAHTITYETENFDTNGYADLGTNNDRLTIPAGVTHVQATGYVKLLNVASGSNQFITIRHTDSSDVLIERYIYAASAGFGNTGASLTTPVLAVSEGDYITQTVQTDDASYDLDEAYLRLTVLD